MLKFNLISLFICLLLSCGQHNQIEMAEPTTKQGIYEYIKVGDASGLAKEIQNNDKAVNTIIEKQGTTPLIQALIELDQNDNESNLKMVNFLLKNGADPNQKSTLGLSPLRVAIDMNHQQAIVLLLQAGASADEYIESHKMNLMDYAHQKGSKSFEVVQTFLKNK